MKIELEEPSNSKADETVVLPTTPLPTVKGYKKKGADEPELTYSRSDETHRKIGHFLTLTLIISAAVYAWSLNKVGAIPHTNELTPAITQAPAQTVTTRTPFSYDYQGKNYSVVPLADYELWGVVVTHNDIHSLGDIYHNSKSVDFKDLCVIWSHNAANPLVQKLHYWSEPWTCFVKPENEEQAAAFNPTELSNNHILSANEKVRELVMKTNVGDQIHLKGMLVTYFPTGHPEMRRDSSLTRTDTGNGACEVVFAEAYEILRPSQPTLHAVLDLSRKLCLLLIILKVVSFLVFPVLEYRSRAP